MLILFLGFKNVNSVTSTIVIQERKEMWDYWKKLLETSVGVLESKDMVIDSVTKLVESWSFAKNKRKTSYLELILKLEDYLLVKEAKVYYQRDGNLRLIVKEDQIEGIINDYHSQIGHLGINKTYETLYDIFYWANMKTTVNNALKMCIPCQIYKSCLIQHPVLLKE